MKQEEREKRGALHACLVGVALLASEEGIIFEVEGTKGSTSDFRDLRRHLFFAARIGEFAEFINLFLNVFNDFSVRRVGPERHA